MRTDVKLDRIHPVEAPLRSLQPQLQFDRPKLMSLERSLEYVRKSSLSSWIIQCTGTLVQYSVSPAKIDRKTCRCKTSDLMIP